MSVQREFERVVKQYIDKLNGKITEEIQPNMISGLYNRNINTDPQRSKNKKEIVEDLENSMPGVIPTISGKVTNHFPMTNGHLGGAKHNQPRTSNGYYVPNGRPNLRSMLQDAELDSHI